MRRSTSSIALTLIKLALPAVLAFVSCTKVVATDQTRGRLADGRAFRVDAKGNEIVDYVAELEIAVDGLERRVRGLEQEITEKKAIIDRQERERAALDDQVIDLQLGMESLRAECGEKQ